MQGFLPCSMHGRSVTIFRSSWPISTSTRLFWEVLMVFGLSNCGWWYNSTMYIMLISELCQCVLQNRVAAPQYTQKLTMDRLDPTKKACTHRTPCGAKNISNTMALYWKSRLSGLDPVWIIHKSNSYHFCLQYNGWCRWPEVVIQLIFPDSDNFCHLTNLAKQTDNFNLAKHSSYYITWGNRETIILALLSCGCDVIYSMWGNKCISIVSFSFSTLIDFFIWKWENPSHSDTFNL